MGDSAELPVSDSASNETLDGNQDRQKGSSEWAKINENDNNEKAVLQSRHNGGSNDGEQVIPSHRSDTPSFDTLPITNADTDTNSSLTDPERPTVINILDDDGDERRNEMPPPSRQAPPPPPSSLLAQQKADPVLKLPSIETKPTTGKLVNGIITTEISAPRRIAPAPPASKTEVPASIAKQLSILPVSSSVLVTSLPIKRNYRRASSASPVATSSTKKSSNTTANKRLTKSDYFTDSFSDATVRSTRSKSIREKASPTTKRRHHLLTGYIYDVYMSYHATLDIFEIHPEDPRRLFYIYREMRAQHLLEKCERVAIKKATHQDILAVHHKQLLQVLRKTKKMGRTELMAMEKESDSIYVNNHSYESSLYAAGGVIELCKAVMTDRIKNGFAIVRPPGHHAESNVSMGFCFINNVAIATKYCLQHLGLRKIMIVDWDVHFGNGTHEIFADNPNVLYLSLHRYDDGWFYPADDNGDLTNVGEYPAEGRSVNIAWPSDGTTDADYIYAFHQIVMPIGYDFAPDLVIVSAGFDAAEGDYIGMCKVSPTGYGHMTHLLKGLANGRLVMALEGGYNLQATSISATACMSVLMGESPAPLDNAKPSPSAVETVEKVKAVQSKYWRSLSTMPSS